MKKTHLLLALALCMPVAASIAQTQPPAFQLNEQMFNQLDTNKDGKVSEDEYRVFMEGAFDKLDTNRDNKLSPAEAAPVLTESEFAFVDKDKDGFISREEFMTQVMSDFHKQDRNGDGFLTR